MTAVSKVISVTTRSSQFTIRCTTTAGRS